MTKLNLLSSVPEKLKKGDIVSVSSPNDLSKVIVAPFTECQSVVVLDPHDLINDDRKSKNNLKIRRKYRWNNAPAQATEGNEAFRLYIAFEPQGNDFVFVGTYYCTTLAESKKHECNSSDTDEAWAQKQYASKGVNDSDKVLVKLSDYHYVTSPWDAVRGKFHGTDLNTGFKPNSFAKGDMITNSVVSTAPYQDTDIHRDTLPEPFYGNLSAKLLLLSMNPKFDSKNSQRSYNAGNILDAFHQSWTLDPKAKHVWADKVSAGHGGHGYWVEKFKNIPVPGGSNLEDSIMSFEYFPYSTKSGFDSLYKQPDALPSYEFSDQLIWRAMFYGKNILLLRMVQEWVTRIPGLDMYDKVYLLRNAQGCYINERNVCQRITEFNWKNILV